MNKFLAVVGMAVLWVGAIGCASDTTSNDPPSTAVENNERTVGNPAVIARIESRTSCEALRREWRIAVENATAAEGGEGTVPLAYAGVASARMRQLRCYG